MNESAFEGNLKNWRWYGGEYECGCGKQQFHMDARPGDTCAVCEQPLRLTSEARRERRRSQQAGSLRHGASNTCMVDCLYNSHMGCLVVSCKPKLRAQQRNTLYSPWDPEQVISRRVREELKVIVAEIELFTMPNYGYEIDTAFYEFQQKLEIEINHACFRIRCSTVTTKD